MGPIVLFEYLGLDNKYSKHSHHECGCSAFQCLKLLILPLYYISLLHLLGLRLWSPYWERQQDPEIMAYVRPPNMRHHQFLIVSATRIEHHLSLWVYIAKSFIFWLSHLIFLPTRSGLNIVSFHPGNDFVRLRVLCPQTCHGQPEKIMTSVGFESGFTMSFQESGYWI